MEIIEDSDQLLKLRNHYEFWESPLHSFLFSLMIGLGIFLMIVSPVNGDTFAVQVNFGELPVLIKGGAGIILLKLTGLFIVLGSLFALSVKRPEFVSFDRDNALIIMTGKSWFGVLPYQDIISFDKVLVKDISRTHSAISLPLKSGKIVFLGVVPSLALIEKIINTLQLE